MSYLVFTDRRKAEEAQAKRDVELGYPEALESLRHIGSGVHAPKELGRALHYCALIEHKDGGQWAITEAGETPIEKEASRVDSLPAHWFPEPDIQIAASREVVS